MRISTTQIFQRGMDSMLDQQARMFKTQMQLSLGKKYLSPADNPTAAAQVLGLNESISVTGQYQANIAVAKSRLELEDGALSSAVDVLQRARELAVRGLNDSLGAEGRRAVAYEMRQLVDEMVALANSQDGNGDYLFGGNVVQTAPFSDDGAGTFSYAGDAGQRSVQINPTRQLPTSDAGLDVFMKVPNPAGGYQDVFSTLNDFAVDLEANAPQSTSLAEIDSAMDHLLEFRAKIGSRLNTLDVQEDNNGFTLLQLETVKSGVQDIDVAEVYSRLQQQTLALQAAQASFMKIQGLSLFNYLP